MTSSLPKPILLMSSFALSILLALILCGCSSSPQEQIDSISIPPPHSTSQEEIDEDDNVDTSSVTTNNENGALLGKTSDIVEIGERHVLITIDFEYKIEETLYKVCNILDAKAVNVDGWVYVANEVLIDTQNILFNSNNTKAFVPVTYSASLGEGMASYQAIIEIDLSDCK